MRALSEWTDTSRVVLLNVPFGSGLLGFMGDEAVDSITSASDHTLSQPTRRSGGPTFFIVFAPSCRCGLDCVLSYRAHDLSVGFDLGFPRLLRAGPCERWAQSRSFGRVLNEQTSKATSSNYNNKFFLSDLIQLKDTFESILCEFIHKCIFLFLFVMCLVLSIFVSID
jgi:hypothetical protein